jgi:hypothetical protein
MNTSVATPASAAAIVAFKLLVKIFPDGLSFTGQILPVA